MEKPFGRDLESAEALNRELHQHFGEDQVYRIDHYLGKETVQNLTVLRFANTLIEPIWNRNYIDHVQITVAEDAGIGTRAGYFDSAGTLRDMVQNHLLQLVSVVAMEPPATCRQGPAGREGQGVPVDPPAGEDGHRAPVVRGQYASRHRTASRCRATARGGRADDSAPRPIVAMRLFIDNWRWRNVPFYLRTGKRLPMKRSQIAIRFRHPPQQLFHSTALAEIDANWIRLEIHPEECVEIDLHAKEPGLDLKSRVMRFSTRYRQSEDPSGDAYETLLARRH